MYVLDTNSDKFVDWIDCLSGACVHAGVRARVRSCVCACVRSCLRTCIRACVRECACVRARVCVRVCVRVRILLCISSWIWSFASYSAVKYMQAAGAHLPRHASSFPLPTGQRGTAKSGKIASAKPCHVICPLPARVSPTVTLTLFNILPHFITHLYPSRSPH